MDDHKKTKNTLIQELQSLRKQQQISLFPVETQHIHILNRISRIALYTETMEETLGKILEEMLLFFNCDRAWFFQASHPEATTISIPFERSRAKWPGAKIRGIEIPRTKEMQYAIDLTLKATAPVAFDSSSGPLIPETMAKDFSVRSQLMLTLSPKVGMPWFMAIHHCDQSHVFTSEEIQVFSEIGLQATEILSRLISFHKITLSEKKYRGLFESMTQGVVYQDAKGQIISANPAAERILGVSLERMKGRFLLSPEWEITQEDGSDFPETSHPCHMALKTGKPVRNVVMGFLDRKTAEPRWVMLDAIPRFHAGKDAPVEVCTSFSDITERKNAEEKVRMSVAIFQNTADAVLITNEKSRIISVNKAFSRITGYSEKEALHQNPIILKSKKHDNEFFKTMAATLKKTGLWQGELFIRRKNQEAFPAWLSITAVYNENAVLINHVSVFSDITPLKRSQAQVDFLAFHDPLTHLPNRLLFNDRLSHSLKRAQRKGYKIALLFLDLDHFKTINDSLGHPIGDILLQQVAERIKSVVRQEDTVARLSGDEFVVIVDRIETQGVTVLAHKLMATFNPPFVINDHELHVTISMGITMYPRDGEDNATLIKNADTAMYQAKEQGRNNYAFYTPALTTAVFKRLTLETELHRAMKNNELVLHYQPQYALETGALIGAEALIRWQHPKLGLLAPEQFIPYAEESDLIVSIGKWVLLTACKQISEWRKKGVMLERIAVNISGAQFLKGEIVKTVKDALKKSKLSPEMLELEITESFFMKNTKWAIKALEQLKGLGVSIAIDDFGTGYSSLSYLKRLPVNKLKIDRSFIRDLPEDINDKAIAQTVLALAHGLHHKVTAEGVETKEQQAYLKDLGCDESQGFLYSPAVSPEKFAALF